MVTNPARLVAPGCLTSDCVGIACGICGQETFQVATRMAALSRVTTVEVRCCPRCARRVDLENEEEQAEVVLEGMGKAGRRQALQEESFRWADRWNGEHVVVLYDVGDGHGGWAKQGCRVQGRAYRMKNACGGWGRVSVILDEGENVRVTHGHHAAFWWLAHDRLDGLDWSPSLRKVRGDVERYCFEVSWGERRRMMLERVP